VVVRWKRTVQAKPEPPPVCQLVDHHQRWWFSFTIKNPQKRAIPHVEGTNSVFRQKK
jgi:hypothetical protein